MFVGIGINLTGQLLSSAFPVSLFAGGEVGVWYDPSDVANLAWRYNLLTYTEAFTNATWLTQGGSWSAVDANGFQTFTEDTATSQHRLYDDGFSVVSGQAYTLSAQVAYGTRRWVFLAFYDGVTTITAWFDLLNGVKGSVTAGATSTMTTVSSGVYNITLTRTSGATSSAANVQIGPQSADGETVGWAGTGATTRIAKYQFELGSTASPYQRISDVNTEVMERFPKATLYQDTAGTTPVTAPAQTVGLMLDKSQGLVLGPELWSDTGVTVGTGWTVASGVYTHTAGVDTFRKDIGLVAGKTYQVTFTVTGRTAGNIGPVYGGSVNGPTVTANGTYTQRVASGTNALLYFQPSTDFVGSVSGISVKELAGNHATQATTASRPIYGINPITGTRNLLTYTEQFDNAAWIKGNSTVTANAAVAPDGKTTAYKLIENSGVTRGRTSYGVATAVGNTISVYAKAAEWNRVSVGISNSSGLWGLATFNLSTGLVDGGATYGGVSVDTPVITPVGNGWYRCSVRVAAGSDTPIIMPFNQSGDPVNPSPSLTGDGTSGILIWGAQLELGSTATAYQRVGSAFDVTEAGVASLSYLSFDGVDDGMVTNTITPAIDKVQVFAGVRKLSDAVQGAILELSVDSTSIGYTSLWTGGPSFAGANYHFNSKGTALATATAPTSYAAPITNVLTGLGDIAGDTATFRVNGNQVAQSTTNQGTGNYLVYPLYIGRRGGTTQPFNGRIYSLITRFGANLTDGQITATEAWVNSKTGAYT